MDCKEKNVAFTIRIPQELKFQIDLLASKEGRSTNNLIKIILREYINKDNKK